jgi:DNA-binding transcriptional ArsR family regulator
MQVNKIALAKTIKVLRAVKHPLRQEMMNTIEESKSINVTELISKFKLQQSVVSQQLAILRNAGVVKAKRDGKQVFYSLNTFKIEHINDLLNQF